MAKPYTTLRLPPFEIQLARIPDGEFLMGSDRSRDKSAFESELPQHRVRLGEFYISRYPITNGQYAAFIRSTGHREPHYWRKKWVDPSKIEDHPLGSVSWYDATAFCQWLATVSGKPFRLPTEAEWEKAARGPDGRIYPWGNQFESRRCKSQSTPGVYTPGPVGTYSPEGDSPYGISDACGTVMQWCDTYFADYPYRSADGRETAEDLEPNPSELVLGTTPARIVHAINSGALTDTRALGRVGRVLRGGNYLCHPDDLRCARRFVMSAYDQAYNGFRVAFL